MMAPFVGNLRNWEAATMTPSPAQTLRPPLQWSTDGEPSATTTPSSKYDASNRSQRHCSNSKGTLNDSEHSASSNVSTSSSTSSSTTTSSPSSTYYHNAVDGVLNELVLLLLRHGVAPASLHELRQSRHHGDYLRVMERAQFYLSCIQRDDAENGLLIKRCYQVLAQHYQEHFRQCHLRLVRAQCTRQPHQVERERKNDLGECVCVCRKQLILLQRRQKLRPPSSSTRLKK